MSAVNSSVIDVGSGLVAVLVALAGLAAVGGKLSGLGQHYSVVVAAVRAALQLAVVSAVLAVVIGSLWLSGMFVLLMVVVAAITSAGRVTGASLRQLGLLHRVVTAGTPIVVGALPVVLVVLASGAVPLRGEAVIPIAGILIGGAMTATSLAGRRLREELESRHGEVEAALALGLVTRDAVLEIARPVAGTALMPALDQTRTVGLVTLPGAFVGVLLGGGSPLQAGAAQLLVLVGLLAAEVTAVWMVTELVARGQMARHGARR
ncbi:putative ABC transport system permease protein [Blastococcus tunisiensis]|uniref:Putative ABC transport system permease protein n=1 Tax=Blastococcus tunisiensis TaxID=1798228 RepID=A0A1I2AFV1_9ACTN|nr:putative ABC transport system permease protein [Blastococcus sp. DSM 46838]